MSMPARLEEIYTRRSEETLRLWQRQGDNALKAEPFYPAELTAIATGLQPLPPVEVVAVLKALQSLTQGDPLADVMQPQNFHLTFLAVTPSIFDAHCPPESTSELKALVSAHCGDHQPLIQDLRLVALPNQLLIAGIPDEESIQRRQALWNSLQRSGWREHLQQRYPHASQPPAFWHSTLLRYQAQQLPQSLQVWFSNHKNQRYGAVTGEIKLRLVTYNWSVVETLPQR